MRIANLEAIGVLLHELQPLKNHLSYEQIRCVLICAMIESHAMKRKYEQVFMLVSHYQESNSIFLIM